jgi:glycosyltransferase involved in cell wall biosynthesis
LGSPGLAAPMPHQKNTREEHLRLAQKSPIFSIIIPTYNRPNELSRCLNSIERLHFSRERFEVIVVDDGSTIQLQEMIHFTQYHFAIKVFRQSNAGPAAARNLGAQQAIGDFLIFIDDDCLTIPGWLSKIEARLKQHPTNVVGGKTMNALRHNPFAIASQMIIDAAYEYYNAFSENAAFFTSNNMTIPSALFRSIGGFKSTFRTSEDREFCDHWLSKGYKMIYAPEIILYHLNRLTLKSYLIQHFNYGRGAYRFHKMHTSRLGLPMHIDSKRFQKYLLMYPLGKANWRNAIIYQILLILSQIASLFGYLLERRLE